MDAHAQNSYLHAWSALLSSINCFKPSCAIMSGSELYLAAAAALFHKPILQLTAVDDLLRPDSGAASLLHPVTCTLVIQTSRTAVAFEFWAMALATSFLVAADCVLGIRECRRSSIV